MIQGAGMSDELPRKLKHDAIVEVLFELRFEHSEVAEVIIGRLATATQWASYQHHRLPFADIPQMARDANPGLRFQPTMQLVRPTPGEIIKVGPNLVSLHILHPYPGWTAFAQRIQDTIDALFSACPSPNIERAGLRYINALTQLHGIGSLWDLDFDFSVADHARPSEIMAAYQFSPETGLSGQITLATPAYVTGNLVPNAVAYVDVDIFSKYPLGSVQDDALKSWAERAHNFEKRAFFSLWPKEILTPLVEA